MNDFLIVACGVALGFLLIVLVSVPIIALIAIYADWVFGAMIGGRT